MTRPVLWLLATAALAAAPPPRVVNTFPLVFEDGRGQIEWVSTSSFRFVRTWEEPEQIKESLTPAPVAVQAGASDTAYSFKTRYLMVEVERSGGRIVVRAGSKEPALDARLRRGVVEQRAAATERFYGLGERAASRFDLRGSRIQTRDAFLLSSAGFGEYFPGRGQYRFNLASSSPDTVEVTVPGERIEFFFYYGPTPKEILEEHLAVAGPVDRFGAAGFRVREARGTPQAGSWDSLAATIRTLLHGSLSAKLIPEFDLTPYAKGDPDLLARAAQVACFMPILRAPGSGVEYGGLLRWRSRLEPYLLSYTKEAQDRGAPVLRPLELDSHEDAAARDRAGEFKVGDELLVAPVLDPSGVTTVYLPRGLWTDLGSGQTYQGRREIRLQPARGEIALLARNGSIVPLRAETGDVLEMHYFPDLAAEFFLFEENDPDISQFHAAPAGDVMRLETESRASRVYDWVIHQTGAPRKVESAGVAYTPVAKPSLLAPGRWYADPLRKLLTVRVRSVAGGDEIVNVTFE